MKKIMFEDNLEMAVLTGYKTMTRRLVSDKLMERYEHSLRGTFGPACVQIQQEQFKEYMLKHAPYKVGDVVAIAQSYKRVILSVGEEKWNSMHPWNCVANLCEKTGYANKMYVRADLMPHQIRFTDVKIELLHSISEEDCLKEGVQRITILMNDKRVTYRYAGQKDDRLDRFDTAQDAFGEMLDKVSRAKVWNKPGYNPWTFAYSFELIK